MFCTKRKKKKRMPSREVVKQAHVRFDASIAVMVPREFAMGQLVRGSVKDSTNKQYDSRLRTLQKFLVSVRNEDDGESGDGANHEKTPMFFGSKSPRGQLSR